MKKILLVLASCALALASSVANAEDAPNKKGGKAEKHAARPARGPAVQAQHNAGPRPGRTVPNMNANRQQVRAPHNQARIAGPKNNHKVVTAPPITAPTNVRVKGAGKHNATQVQHFDKARGSTQASAVVKAPNAAVATTTTNPQPNNRHGQGRKLDPQVVQRIRSEHANFRAQPRPQNVPAVSYNQNYRITGAERWQGAQYQPFRSYHPEMHDRGWYGSHYNRIEVIAGGAYFWNHGYWYPAWGYDPSAQYYPYDGPIYVGSSALPPDRVIADVQAALQEQGYYRGEVDGLLGPLTREALSAYQADNGLYATSVIDEPTLTSLGLG